MSGKNQSRMDELCALKRPLTDEEGVEVMRLKRTLCNMSSARRRYARDADYRRSRQAASLFRYHARKAHDG